MENLAFATATILQHLFRMPVRIRFHGRAREPVVSILTCGGPDDHFWELFPGNIEIAGTNAIWPPKPKFFCFLLRR
jgi:hypothetical protein